MKRNKNTKYNDNAKATKIRKNRNKNIMRKLRKSEKIKDQNTSVDEKYVQGTLIISARGTGFVKLQKESSLIFKEVDVIEIDSRHLNTGLHGDQVKVLLHPTKSLDQARDQRASPLTGEVVEVLIRAKSGFAGILEHKEGSYWLCPSDQKMYTDIIIPQDKLAGAKIGQKVFAVITSWQDPHQPPEGKIVEVLGKPGDNESEMRAIALEKGFSTKFPAKVLKELDKFKNFLITKEEMNRRKDFRSISTFTIDPEDAKDFDDAISFRTLGKDLFEIGIHIADVSYFVRPGTELDKESFRRGTSVYLVDRTIPMLPEILSNDLCSIRPNEDKLCMSAVFEISRDGKVKKQWFGRTMIHSNKRFNYEEAQEILDKKHGLFYEELLTLNTIAKNIRKKRFEKGAISLDQEEIKFVLDEKSVPIKVIKKERQDTNRMIEEWMLLANRKIAEYMSSERNKRDSEHSRGIFVYRVHDLPPEENIHDLVLFLKQIGFNLKTQKGRVSPHDLNTLIKNLEGRPEKSTVQTAIIRSMAKAIYSTKNIGHFGLAFAFYTHFTSPIRRYPDIAVHRLLNEALTKKYIKTKEWDIYETVANFSSMREKEAANAERASIKYKQVEYMSSRIGKIYSGIITGITNWGIFVEETETKCEGLVRMRDMQDDYYMYSQKDIALIGKRTRKKYRLGDKVKIKVKDANLNQKTIDYVLV